ncbi:MAG: cobalamin-dependent protein [Candidatus Sericytochromatia bacterium]
MTNKLLLINPPRQKNGNNSLFNNALLWIASYLEENDIPTKVLFLEKNFENELENYLISYKPNFVGISLKWWDTIYSAEYIAKKVKEFDSNIFVFCGGQTATHYAKEILETSLFDAVIEGDGETSILNLINGENYTNCKIKVYKNIVSYEKKYIQTNESIKNLKLNEYTLNNISFIDKISNYIWTGKGCSMTCFYCGGGREGQKETFGRIGYIYRNVDTVINDIELITNKTKSNLFMLDYDPLAKGKEAFYLDLLKKLPKKKYSCEFYFWTLPSKEFIDLMSETFENLIFGFDLQVFSENLRKKLAKLNFIKPIFYTNDFFEDILSYCQNKNNIAVGISGLLGVPYEEKEDIKEIFNFSYKLFRKYRNIYSVLFSPITLEPASALLKYPDKYEVELLRKNYNDFRNYTKEVFENNFLDQNFSNYNQYLKYTGLKRKTHNEEDTFNLCFEVQEKITELFYSRYN